MFERHLVKNRVRSPIGRFVSCFGAVLSDLLAICEAGPNGGVQHLTSIKTSFCILGKAHFDLMRGVRRKKRKVKYKKMKTKSPGRSRHPRFLR